MAFVSRRFLIVTGLIASAIVASAVSSSTAEKSKKAKADPAAVERTRKTVRMLDDVYKTAVVLITEHYVKSEDTLPAGSAAKALFAAIKKKGWHEVKLLDASGEPYNDENVATDEFEKSAIERLRKGESFVDKVEIQKGKPVLRAATPIPVVLEKCIMCHENYRSAKKGAPIGALLYTIPVE